MTPQPPNHDDRSTGWAMGGLGLAMVVCCGLPLLIAGGALSGAGALLGNPWVLGAAALVLVVGLTRWLRRSSSGDATCCPPRTETDQPDLGSATPHRREES